MYNNTGLLKELQTEIADQKDQIAYQKILLDGKDTELQNKEAGACLLSEVTVACQSLSKTLDLSSELGDGGILLRVYCFFFS